MIFDHDWKNYPELSNTELQEICLLSPHPQITHDFAATVVRVHDGDTISLSTSFRDFVFPMRFLDIDSPELSHGGDLARDYVKGLIEGQDVQIEIDPNNRVEKYGRLLGRVKYNGLDVGQMEISLGLAKPFGFKLEGEIPPAEKLFSMKQWF